MVLDAAAFKPLRLLSWVDVPVGALNHTGVMRDRNALLLLGRAVQSRWAHRPHRLGAQSAKPQQRA